MSHKKTKLKHNTNPYSEGIFETRRTSLAFTRQFLERLQGSILFFYGTFESSSSNVEQTLIGASQKILYEINKNLKGNLEYTFSNSAIAETPGYTKNTIFLGLTAEF